jgi:hypothetical protein
MLTPLGPLLLGVIALLVLSIIYLATIAAVKLRNMKTSLRKTGESQYEVVVDEQTIGLVWSWHGSWTAQANGKTYHGHKSRKQAVERVERIHESHSH